MSKLRASTLPWAFSSALLTQGWTIASPSFIPSRPSIESSRSEPKIRIRSSSSDEVEVGAARVALAAGAAAQLVVDAPALVALGGEHVEAAGGEHPRLGVGDLGLDAAAELGGIGRARRPSRRPRARCTTRMSTLPPSWMSVPRPAMLVAMVTAPGTPASAMMPASCSW